jgi:VCBS repeat-containing protein
VVVPVPSVIGAVVGAAVQEDVNVQPGNLLAHTGLIAVTAATPALATFSTNVVGVSSNLGTLSIDTLGSYSYSVSNAVVQYLGVADSKIDTFTIATVDGTTKEVRVTILGTNDAATIGDLSAAAVTEDLSVIANQLRARGTLSIVDIDQNQSVFQTTVIGAADNLGTLVLAANGSYTYSVANAAVQYLGAADSKIETFTVKSLDGTEKVEQVTIFGVNDAAVIGDLPVANVTEDLNVVANQLVARGTISITDVDQQQASFQTVVGSAADNLGALTLATDGQYTYSVANAAVQYLGALDTKLETFTVTSFDGTTKIEQVTIHGVNDAAVIIGPVNNTVTEDAAVLDGKLTASGFMAVTDVDQNQSTFQTAVTPVGSTLGRLVLGADGLYSFTVLNADAQYLGADDSKVDTFTVKSFDGTAKDVSFTTFGTNDPAIIGDPTVADVTESYQVVSGNLKAAGTISVSDVDQNQSGFQTGVTTATGALGNLVLAVDGSYVYSVANASVLYLGDAETKVDIFTIKSIDGTTKDVSFTIHGTNQGAVIGDPSPAAVVEDFKPVSGLLTETGKITITDPDTGEAKFQTAVTAATGDKGQLVLAEDGTYTYSVVNQDVQYLGAGVTKTDTFTIKSFDGTSKAVHFTITGVNDEAVIGDPNPASVTEDLGVFANKISASGQLAVSDIDAGESSFRTIVTAATGDKGQLTLSTDGRYTYSVLNADVQYLGAGITQTDTFTVKSFDGTAKDISFTITGVNDAAVIGGPVPGAVTEDLSLNGLGRLTETGRLTVSDVDTGESSFRTVVTTGAGDLGQLTLATDGSYAYSVANADVQYLGEGDTKVDTFTIKSFDGTAKDVSFTIIGMNDGAIIGDPTNSIVIEDTNLFRGNLVASGTISITDPDQGQSSFKTAVAPLVNAWGSLTLTTDGSYTYSVANNLVALQALNEGQTKVDQFTITSFDGTKKVVDFNIKGLFDGLSTNVAPVVGPLIQQSFFVGDAQKNIPVGGPDKTLAFDSQDGVNLNRGSATYWVDGNPVSQLPSWIKFTGPEQVINVDPSYVNADLFNLATGSTKVVDINYVISDNNGGKVAQSAMITVTGKDIYTPVFASTSGLTDVYSAGSHAKTIDLLDGMTPSSSGAVSTIKNVVIAVDGVDVQTLPGMSGPIGGGTTSFSIDTSNSAYTSMAAGQSKTAVISYDVVNTVTGHPELFKSTVQTEVLTIVNGAAVAPSTIIGTSRSDVLRAADTGQTLIGVGGNDTLIGGKGNDTLISGGGSDVLTGGGGTNTFKYVSLADSPTSKLTATDTITDFSKAQGDKIDLSGILNSSSTVTSTVNLDQAGHDSSTVSVTVGGATYDVATVSTPPVGSVAHDLSTPDLLANPASGTNLTTALHGASWTTVVDVSGSTGAPSSVTASGPTASVSGATANPTGNWTEVVTAGAAVVDTTASHTTFTTPSASNAVAITTADTVHHDVSNVTVVQWHA